MEDTAFAYSGGQGVMHVIAMVGLGVFLLLAGMLLLTNGTMVQRRVEGHLPWWRGAILGASMTVVLQSSSAMTALLVAAVSRGMMRAMDAFGWIIGANVGTCITAWILTIGTLPGAFGVAMPLLLSAVIFCLTRSWRAAGGLLLMLLGMRGMSAGTESLIRPEILTQALESPWRGTALGMMVTAVLQSSSAVIGMLQAVAGPSGLRLSLAAPVAAGSNIGTCATALLASIPANSAGRRVAVGHLLFNLFSFLLFCLWCSVGGLAFLNRFPADAVSVAAFHTGFNLVPALLLIVGEGAVKTAVALLRRSRYDSSNKREKGENIP